MTEYRITIERLAQDVDQPMIEYMEEIDVHDPRDWKLRVIKEASHNPPPF